MIEKRITQQLLEAGELVLTPTERAALELPEHSTTITIRVEGEPCGAQWSGRSRKLSGDQFTERLQDYGQVGGLLRLRLLDQIYRLVLLPPGATLQVSQPVLTRTSSPQTTAGKKAAHRRATVDRQFHADNEYDWGPGTDRTIGFLTAARNLFSEQLKAAGFDPLELVELRLQGEELATLDNFEELLAVDVANVDRMPHQEAVARHALSRLRGRAVLADEVGLGKTIEAGLAVKELTLRGLAKRVLILCPAPLRDQWREEMDTKFDLAFDVAYRGPEVRNQDKLILSLQLAASNIDKLTARPWDVVIVDEAHRAAGSGARKRRELITALTTACRYAFFLTATPVQNDLLELYRLIELLRPGTFTSVSAFKRQYMRGGDPRRPNDPAALRRLISSAMIRTTRAQAGVDRVVRRPVDLPIDLGTRERELYALSTDLLRNVMREPSDTMRRRSLALRLTASPFSMGTTALRMAERHPDERVRKVLGEIGHMAMDIKGFARENAAIQITRDWIRDHGRVLIFTQHTDTVTGLLRRMGEEDLKATAFHGSMSARKRAATIAAFRSGDAPVMISTDAGAEGQNLQFCNCVLNYDLPWNPMRIEQRIGRVDRLTQPRDEVFVANLYARNTVDENVYRLLAEKLRMFELLFGQVTTILGELDDSKSATFESRVLEALFAPDDIRMESLLSQLGTELADARKRASTLIAADSGLSSWMASANEHRKGLTKAGSTELAPEIAERARIRQRRVQAWVRRVIEALDAQTIHDTGDGDGAFLTVQFGDELTEELGGRTLLHIAFDRHGMEHHPDAELCAVGSPVFDELLGLLRVRGDMHATVPVIPEDPGPSPFRHAPNTKLVRRRLVPSGSWSGHATFRATVGEAETTEHVITAVLRGENDVRLPRRPLHDGECLSPAFDEAAEIVAAFQQAAGAQLEAHRLDRAEQLERDRAIELERIQNGYSAQITEAAADDRIRLQRALRSEEQRLGREPDVRARAKMLAVIVDEDDWIVEETWAGPNATERTLTYEWGLPTPPVVGSDATGEPIRTLTLCSAAHLIDQAESSHCGSCDSYLCAACGEDAAIENCAVCFQSTCGSCRARTAGLCLGCSSPVRAPELDRQFAVAWRMGNGVTILVGHRVVELARPRDATSYIIVPDSDINDKDRARMRSYALHNKLPADTGLVLRDLRKRPATSDTNALVLHSSKLIEIELTTEEVVGSALNREAIADVPVQAARPVFGEKALNLSGLLVKLRMNTPPPASPAVVVTRRARFTDVCLEQERLVERTMVVGDDGTLEAVAEREGPLTWQQSSPTNQVLAEGQLAELRVSVERRNEALAVRLWDGTRSEPTQTWVTAPHGMSPRDQLAWFDILQSIGTPGGRVGQRRGEATSMVQAFPSPSECSVASRYVTAVAEIGDVDDRLDLVSAQQATLKTLGMQNHSARGYAFNAMPGEVSRTLLERAEQPFTAVVRNGFEIRETWKGHSVATFTYRTFEGLPVAPILDDIGHRQNDFGVCRDGHFYAAGSSALCESCATWSCRACDETAHRASVTCPKCAASVCPRCVSQAHSVPETRCILCNDAACTDCGRNPQVHSCPICERNVCGGCQYDSLCPACSHTHPASAEQLHSLPIELALEGSKVLIGSDADATTLLIDRGAALEHVLIRAGALVRWVAFGRSNIDDAYKLRLAASRKLRAQVNPVIKATQAETPIAAPHLVVQSHRHFYATWSASGLGVSGKSTRQFDSPDSNIMQAVAEEFAPTVPLPTAIAVTPEKLKRAFKRDGAPQLTELVLRWSRCGHDIAVTEAGLLDRTMDEDGLNDRVIAWAEATNAYPWAGDGWNPSPRVHAAAECSAASAVIVGLASMLALGVRLEDCTFWYTISESPHAPFATALARWIGGEDVDVVSNFVDPKKVRLSQVVNAVEVSTKMHPVAETTVALQRTSSTATADALAAWLPEERVRAPEFSSLPSNLASRLQHRIKPAGPPAGLAIGALIEQVITVEGGHAWRHDATLMPGDTDARRLNHSTKLPLDHGIIDREGHFGPEGPRCAYCEARVCGACDGHLVSCSCCAAAICKRCASEPRSSLWLCPACSTMRPPSRKEARQHGRILLTRNMLIGVDQMHVVVVERTKDQWSRHNDNGEKIPMSYPALAAFLDEQLGTAER